MLPQVLRGDRDKMNTSLRWKLIVRVRRLRAVQPAAVCTCFGGILVLITSILGAFTHLDVHRLIALAVLAIVITISGLISMLIPNAGVAWRRGFEQGCRAGSLAEREGPSAGTPVTLRPPKPITPRPNSAVARTPRPFGQEGLPPAAL